MEIWHTVEIHFKDGTCKIHCIDKNSTEGMYVYEEGEYVNFIKHEGGLFP